TGLFPDTLTSRIHLRPGGLHVSEPNYVTEAMKQAIGIESEPTTFDVEKWHIKRFAEAVGDENPLYTNEVSARKTRYGSVIAPPTFFRAFFPKDPKVNPFLNLPLKRILDGGSDWEWFEPVRPGDRITATSRLASVQQKSGRLGAMLLVSY